jgi:recombination protein RecT
MQDGNAAVQTAPQQTAPTTQAPQKLELVEQVLGKISNFQTMGDLKLPANYSAENSVRAAWLLLQDGDALTVCTPQSIANALLKMVLQGLNPNKHQCAFIKYGNKLTMQREYAGSIAIAKRNGMKSVTAQVVYAEDDFEFLVDTETALKKVTKHVQTLASMSTGKIIGAYAMVELEDGRKSVEVMTMGQIQSAWNMGATKGQSPAHKNFPDQMCMKTVINRAVKLLINSSDDADLFGSEDDELPTVEGKAEVVRQEIKENANKQEIGFDDQPTQAPAVEIKPEVPQTEKAPF